MSVPEDPHPAPSATIEGKRRTPYADRRLRRPDSAEECQVAVTAVLLLGYLVGPLQRAGFRGAVVSIDKAKAAVLTTQIQDVARSSGLLDGLTFVRSPWPGRIVSKAGGTVEVLAPDVGGGTRERAGEVEPAGRAVLSI